MKIAVIGSGSTYTPELVEGLIAHGSELGLKSLYLMDINSERLRVVGGLVGRMVAKAGNSFRVELTESRREAVAGADLCYSTACGGQQARHRR